MAGRVNDYGTARVIRNTREDGLPGSSMLVPMGHGTLNMAASTDYTLTPPTPNCVAITILATTNNVRCTFDGVTAATANVGFLVASGGTPGIWSVKPQTNVLVNNGATAQLLNYQWYEAV